MIFTLTSVTLYAAAAFFLALLMNLVRKNTTLVTLYLLQSVVTSLALISLAYSEGTIGLLWAGLLTLAVKAVMAPAFLMRMIQQYSAHFSATSYLSLPLSMLALAVMTAFSYSFIAESIRGFSASPGIPLLFAAIFSILFLMVNRRGALAAVVGVLALENAIILVAAFLGLHHSFGLEFAIAFDIAVWIGIAVAFLTMMHRQFGAVDTATLTMTQLTEE